MAKRGKVYVLEIFFKDEEDLKTFVDNHFNDEQQLDVGARKKDGWDQLHLKDYTKKVYVMKPNDKMDSMAHLWLKPVENMTVEERKENLQQNLDRIKV